MTKALIALVAALMLGLGARAASPPARPVAARAAVASGQLASLFAAYWEDRARLFPLQALAQGDYRYNDRLPNDQTQAFRGQQQRLYRRYLLDLLNVDRARLPAEDKLSYDIFQYDLRGRLEGLQLTGWMTPFTQLGSLPVIVRQLGTGTSAQPFRTVRDYDDWLARAGRFPVWADSAIANFRRGGRAGVVLPRVLVLRILPQLQLPGGSDMTRSPFYGPIARLPADFPPADRRRLTAAYQRAIVTQLGPAYRRLADFLQAEYLPLARASAGLDAVPGGDELYRYDVRLNTTTDRAPEALYQTGLAEVKRLRAAMETVRKQVKFKGPLPAFFTYLKTSPRFRPYRTPDDVLAAFRAIEARVQPQLGKLFSREPRAAFEIRQTEALRAATAPAEYSRGTPDGSRPGVFYVPIPDATEFATTSGMESLFLHEALPGHHYQVSLQQENTVLPAFRRFGSYPAFSEGWALYCESLGTELGLYADPYQRMGALSDEMHRALRLVVDVGLHTRGLTREQAVAYLLTNEPIEEAEATAEVERYMALPGQALAYKTGALKLREMRTRYEQQLGRRFNLRAFHDEILAGGAMPLAVLERRMDSWALRQR